MKPILALEINENWLKLGAVSYLRRGSSDQKFIAKPITSFSDSQITEALNECLRELKIKSASVILCLPRNQVTLRNLHLPSQNIDEIKQMIELNVGRIVPYRKEEIIYNYKLLGKDEMGHAKMIISIVHRDIIKRLATIIEMTGLSIEDVFLSSYGSLGYVLNKHKTEIKASDLNLLLDIDSGYADLIIFSDNTVIYSRSITVEANQILQEIGIKKLIGEIRQSLVIFHNEETSKKPVVMYVSGARVNTAGLVSIMEKELEMPVKDVPTDCQQQKNFPQLLSVAAIAEFISRRNPEKYMEFLLPEIEVRKSLNKKTKDLMILGSLLVYLFMAIGGLFYSKIYNQQLYLDALKEKNKKMFGNIEDVIKKSREEDFVKETLSSRKMPLFFLGQLVKIVPQEIAIKYVNVDKDKKVSLKGEAQQLSDVFKFVGILEKAKYLKDVQTKSTRKRKVGDKEVTDFELAFVLDL